MPKFRVLITEILTKIVTVEAKDKQDALYKVEDMRKDGKCTLYSEDFLDVEFGFAEDGLKIQSSGNVIEYYFDSDDYDDCEDCED
ncbi:MAG: DpnD/PcfM family protein [Synergistaceae bacterium]|nr:DpnD/PcfM family protein [Synergistaceae bacterium]